MKKGMILISRREVLRLIAEAEEMALRYDDFAYYLRSKIDELETVKNTNAKYTEKEMLEELKKREAALDRIAELQSEIEIRPCFGGIPVLQTCARCGKTYEQDFGGVPCDPDNPYYGRWICDECEDQIFAEMEGKKDGAQKS